MKLFIVAFVMLVLLLPAACKKDSNSYYYLQADINGVTENFNTDVYAQEYSGDLTASFNISGKGNTAQRLFVSIGHPFSRVVKEGTYNKTSMDSMFFPQIFYVRNDTINYTTDLVTTPNSITITVSQLTGNLAVGTFAGNVYNNSNHSDSIVITNGKFHVPVKQ